MKVLFDINVVLDIVGRRLPFYEDSGADGRPQLWHARL